MAKYHIKDNGEPGVCKAQPGKCPKAQESEHYVSAKDAREAYEQRMASQLAERFEKNSHGSWEDTNFQEKLARRRRVEDAVLNANAQKTVLKAPSAELPRTWDNRSSYGFYVHPEFRKAIPDDEDFAVYVEMVQFADTLSEAEKNSASVHYDARKGLFVYSYFVDRHRD